MGQEKEKKKRNAQQSYSWELKKQVVAECLHSGASKASILRKHNIHFAGAFNLWCRQLGYEDFSSKKPSFVSLNRTGLKRNFSEDTGDGRQDEASLKKRIKELERQLEDEKFRSEAYNMMIDIAEKELKISIRKKTNTK
jgi:transposase